MKGQRIVDDCGLDVSSCNVICFTAFICGGLQGGIFKKKVLF